MIKARGTQPEPLPLGSKMSLGMTRAMQRFSPPSTSKIAEMMISGNTKGVIKSIQHHRQYLGKDERVTDLSKKLLETEQSNIEQMKPFL
jgi:beta-lactamase class D